MFPQAPDQARPARRSFRAALSNAADLAIAFLTLESYGLDDLRRPRAASPADGVSAGVERGTGVALRPGPEAGDPALAHAAHRRALQPPRRPRRPGTPDPRDQICLTPLVPSSGTLTTSTRRRTAPQGAAH